MLFESEWAMRNLVSRCCSWGHGLNCVVCVLVDVALRWGMKGLVVGISGVNVEP